jgi:dynein heavy chain 1
MFAGICAIKLNDEVDEILGFSSKEGEEVVLKSPISVKKNPKINDWLTLLEGEMKMSLALLLEDAIHDIDKIFFTDNLDSDAFLAWIRRYPAQLIVLAMQVLWTLSVETSLSKLAENKSGDHLASSQSFVERGLDILADLVLTDQPVIMRKKCEHLITELVHQRDLIRDLSSRNVASPQDFAWLYQMRFYFDPTVADPLSRLTIRMANATFFYGFEYHGVCDRLVQTPLTDRCYLTLTQALDSKLGGSPFGPGIHSCLIL